MEAIRLDGRMINSDVRRARLGILEPILTKLGQSSASLVVPGNGFTEGIALEFRSFSKGENSISLIGRQQRLCIVSFLEVSLLENFFCGPGVVFSGG